MTVFTQNEDARNSKQIFDQLIGCNRLNHNYVKLKKVLNYYYSTEHGYL